MSPNYGLNENSSNKLTAAVLGFESGIIYFPARLELEIDKLFNTDDDDTGYEPPAPPPIVDEIIRGDADRDGVVTASDARSILRCAVGLEDLDKEQMKRADINGDGVCSADEARSVLRVAAGLEVL